MSIYINKENTRDEVFDLDEPGGYYKLIEDISFTNQYNRFSFLADNITFDGNGKTILLNISGSFHGLFFNGTELVKGKDKITIKNLNVNIDNSNLKISNKGTILCRRFFAHGVNITIENCKITGKNIQWAGNNPGGVFFGRRAAKDNGNIKVINCQSSFRELSHINNLSIGGFFADNAANGGTITVSNCHFSGNIMTPTSGGFFSLNAADMNGTITVTNCRSIGDINDSNSGGFFGFNAAKNNSTITVTNCYSSGDICGGSNAGGIFGSNAADNSSTIKIRNSYVAGRSGNTFKTFFGGGDSDVNFELSSAGYTDASFESFTNGKLVYDSCNTDLTWDSFNAAKILTGELNVINSYTEASFNDASYIWFNDSKPFVFNWQYRIDINQNNINTYLYNSIHQYKLTANVYCLIENITIINNSYFIFDADHVIFDGSGFIVTISNVDEFDGLFENGENNVSGHNNITIRNLNIVSSNSSSLSNKAGWLCKESFGRDAQSNTITNCSINGDIYANNAGGICGANCASGGTITVTYCSYIGNISGDEAGGFFGSYAADNSGTITVTNCSISGDIIGHSAGGIFGAFCASGGTITVTNCSISGDIIGHSAGGIFGAFCASSGTITVTNCYSIGDINHSSAGGIFGSHAADNSGTILVEHFYIVNNNINNKNIISNFDNTNNFYDNLKSLQDLNDYKNNRTINKIALYKYQHDTSWKSYNANKTLKNIIDKSKPHTESDFNNAVWIWSITPFKLKNYDDEYNNNNFKEYRDKYCDKKYSNILNNERKINKSFKESIGVAQTMLIGSISDSIGDSVKDLMIDINNESLKTYNSILRNEILIEDIPNPPEKSIYQLYEQYKDNSENYIEGYDTSNSQLKFYYKIKLEVVPDTQGTSWYRRIDPDDFHSQDHNLLKDIIPFMYCGNKTDASNNIWYMPILEIYDYSSNEYIYAGGQLEERGYYWFIDANNGIIKFYCKFENPVNLELLWETVPPKLSFMKYTGRKLNNIISASGDIIIGNAEIGNAYIGRYNSLKNEACFSHIDNNTNNDFALVQRSKKYSSDPGVTILNSSSTIHFAIDGSACMFLDESNNFGIGDKADPDTKLHVHGDIKITGTHLLLDNAERRELAGGETAGGETAGGDYRRALVHDNDDKLTINYNNDYPGGVKIGSEMTVTGDAIVNKLKFVTRSSDNAVYIEHVDGSNNHAGFIFHQIDYGTVLWAPNTIWFKIGESTTEIVKIDSTGMTVHGDISSSYINDVSRIAHGVSGDFYEFMQGEIQATTISAQTIDVSTILINGSPFTSSTITSISMDMSFANIDISENLRIKTPASTLSGGDIRLYIDGSNMGHVQAPHGDFSYLSIDTFATIRNLTIYGDATINGNATINNAYIGEHPTNSQYICFSHINNNDIENNFAIIQNAAGETILNAASDKQIEFRIGNDTNKGMIFDNNGDLGIGINSPDAKLHVNGNVKITGPDLILDNTVRRGGNGGSLRRALVHDGGDILSINYANTYIGGVKIGGGVSISNTGDSTFGNTAIFSGELGGSNSIRIGHKDVYTTLANASYAFSQLNDGATIINAASGKNIHFSIKNGLCAKILSNGNFGIGIDNPSEKLHVNGNATINNAYIYSDSDVVYIKHVNQSGGNHAGFVHYNRTYGTVLWSDIKIELKIGAANHIIAQINSAGMTVNGDATISSAFVGNSSVWADHATFSHKDYNTENDYALIQRKSDGRTYLNSPVAVDFRIGHDNHIMEITNSQVEIRRNIKITDTDLMIDHNESRRGQGGTHRRALVHLDNDILTMNYNNEYTGGVKIGNSVTINNNGEANFGFACVGTNSVHNTYANFSHNQCNTETKYALIQDNFAETILNGNKILFRILQNSSDKQMTFNSYGNFGIGISPNAKLHVNGNARIDGNLNLSNKFEFITQTVTPASNIIQYNGNTHPSYDTIELKSGTQSIFKYNTDHTLNTHFYYFYDRIPYFQINVQLRSSNNAVITSDDRLKHNEVDISNGLQIIRQLNPQKYQKTKEMYPADYRGDISGPWVYESGLIAQDILDISDIKYCVFTGQDIDSSGNLIEIPYSLNYNDIFVYGLAATKELDAKNTILENKVDILENKVDILENKVKTLEEQIISILAKL